MTVRHVAHHTSALGEESSPRDRRVQREARNPVPSSGRPDNSSNDPGARESTRKETWTDGFLTSNGAQMPLFVRPANRFKHP